MRPPSLPSSPHSVTGNGSHATLTENEPFLASLEPPLSPSSASDDRATSVDDGESRRRSHSGRDEHAAHSTQRQVSVRLLRALPPQLSQWLQTAEPRRRTSWSHRDEMTHDSGEEDATVSLLSEPANAIMPRLEARGERGEASHGSSQRRSTARPPVTLRVVPIVAPQAAASGRIGMLPIQTVEIDVNESELPTLVPLHSAGVTDAGEGIHPAPLRPASARSSDEAPQQEEEEPTAMEELHTISRRCHHSLPFAALFLVYFAYQHATGIIVFILGSVAIAGLDERLRKQVALKDDANRMYLVGMMAMALVDAVAVSTIGGNVNPLRHLTRQLEPPSAATLNSSGPLFVDVTWLVLINDFILRLWSLALKAVVALVRPETLTCVSRRQPVGYNVDTGTSSSVIPPSVSEQDLELGSRRKLTRSNVAFYRRKRKLFGIIELASIFVRSLLAGVPWCSYYLVGSSKYVGNLFTFIYIFGKGIILTSQGRQLLRLVRSFMTQGLEHASYVTREELEAAACPDCSICYETMQNPVKLACTHMFCEECVMEWFDRERSCPLCRAAVAAAGSEAEFKPQYLDGSTSLFPQLF